MRTLIVAAIVALMGTALAAEAPVKFTKKPTARRDGKNVKIEFAVDRNTDVAVYIANAKGETVRHLVAGALGKNPPKPLKAGSLAQSITWDGKDDDGKPAAGGPFKVRVAAGMKANYSGTAFSEKTGPNHITCVLGMAAGPDGRVYVMDARSGWLYWPAYALHVFRRDGSYEKTIKPFPSNLPPARLKGTAAFKNKRGYLNPIIHRTLGMTFYPYEDEPARQMTVTPKGHLILTVVPTQSKGRGDTRGVVAHLAAIDKDGGVPYANYAGPALGKGLVYRGERGAGGARLAASSDGKHVYMVNVGHSYYKKGYKFKPHHVVYRVPLPAMGPAGIFFGEKDKPGGDGKHLNGPMGLAIDGKGHLLVADKGNNRVVVLKESDASFVGAFKVDAPEWVGVHPKTGAVYVHSKNELIKFSGWKSGKEVSRLNLGRFSSVYAGWGNAKLPFSFALDASAEPAVLWVGRGRVVTNAPLLRCEDRGTKFSDLEPAKCFATPTYWRPASDPTHRLVSCRIDPIDRRKPRALHVIDETTGKTRKVRIPRGRVGNGQGTTSRLDRHGNVYSSAASGGIWKCDPKGKLIPFPATEKDPKLKGHLPGGSTGTTAWERDIYVDRKGDIYAKVRGTSYHGLMHVDVFGPDGKKKRTVLWGVTDGGYGPRVDPKGNVYMMECVKPVGQPFPDEFKPHVTDRWVKHWYDWMYGSIVKFSPAGGNIWLSTRRKKDAPRAAVVKLPDSFKKEKVYATFRGGQSLMQGALWYRPGVAHLGDMGVQGGGNHCHCTGCDFDVDDFGRSFAPDNGRQRVTVIDTNGNVIFMFGAYGNQDYCGPESYVLDPKGKFLRPRKPGDPKDMKSPFAKPEIAFNFIIGLAVTDGHAYVADCANRRVLRVKLGYAAEETAAIR